MRYVLLVACVAIFTSLFVYEHNKDEEPCVVLEIERPSSVSGAIYSEDIFVNNIKLDTIRNGRTETLKLKPSPDGKFTIFTRLADLTGNEMESEIVTVQAQKGATIHARSVMDWHFFGKCELKLKDVAVEQPDREIAERNGDRSQPETLKKSNTLKRLPWDAIGAIAGVVCALFAALGFWR